MERERAIVIAKPRRNDAKVVQRSSNPTAIGELAS